MVVITRLGLMNEALVNLGIAQKMATETTGPFARTIGVMFDPVFETALTYTDWNFAIAYQELSQLDETPKDKNYLHSFLMPADALTIKGLKRTNSGSIVYNYEIVFSEGQDTKILTNDLELIAKYTKLISVSVLPRWFATYVAAELAYRCRNSLTLSGTKSEEVEKTRNQARLHAVITDAQEQPLSGLDTGSSIEEAHNSVGGWDWGI